MPNRTALNPWLMALVVVACCALPDPAGAQEREQVVYPSCREVRNLDALQYWFWDGYFGLVDIRDFTEERWGRLGVDPSVCIRIARVVVDNPEMKTYGYRQAVDELLQWVPEQGNDGDENAQRAKRQLERLTGEDFDSRSDWTAWWEESGDYVIWSDDEDHLVVMEDAQDAGAAVHDDALILEAEEYWFYAGRGWISDTEIVGDMVFGTVLIPPHSFNFRADTDELEDRSAKGNGYRRALDNLFVDGLLLPDTSDTSRERLIGFIATITGETFPDKESWVSWWEDNRGNLVLSRSGENLVVRQ